MRAERVRVAAGRGDEQRRRDLVERADVVGAGALQLRGGYRGDGERHVGEHLGTALGSDDDLVGIACSAVLLALALSSRVGRRLGVLCEGRGREREAERQEQQRTTKRRNRIIISPTTGRSTLAAPYPILE